MTKKQEWTERKGFGRREWDPDGKKGIRTKRKRSGRSERDPDGKKEIETERKGSGREGRKNRKGEIANKALHIRKNIRFLREILLPKRSPGKKKALSSRMAVIMVY